MVLSLLSSNLLPPSWLLLIVLCCSVVAAFVDLIVGLQVVTWTATAAIAVTAAIIVDITGDMDKISDDHCRNRYLQQQQ